MKLSKKILIFCPYYPPHIGGLESHADEFNKYLSPHIKRIVVFTPHLPQGTPQKELKYGNVEIIRFPAFEIISNYPVPKFWLLKFWKLFFNLFKNDYNLVISRTRFFLTSLIALIFAKIKRRRWIHIEHGSDFVRLSSNFKTFTAKIYDYILGRLVFKSSNLNISISKAVQRFVFKFDKRESPIIYRGIDFKKIEKIKPDTELKKKYQDKAVIAFVGRLYKWKGVGNSINAIKNFPEEIKQKIIFLIIGSGEDFSRLKNIIDKNDPIVMLSNLPHEKAVGILKISNIYIHSSLPGGGLSTSLLEAMACGCAVIATPNEGADEVINEKNGMLIERSEENLIAEKIKEILQSGTGNCHKEKNQIIIKEKFGWNESINKYLKIIKDTKNEN
jgi:glycosyltransferase involved in cell wall biosynthesis